MHLLSNFSWVLREKWGQQGFGPLASRLSLEKAPFFAPSQRRVQLHQPDNFIWIYISLLEKISKSNTLKTVVCEKRNCIFRRK
jgi:hypothetical protein